MHEHRILEMFLADYYYSCRQALRLSTAILVKGKYGPMNGR